MALDFQNFSVSFHSVPPGMLMHSSAYMLQENPSKPKTDEEECERAAYRNDKGQLILPTVAFRNSLLTASTGRKAKGSKGAPVRPLWRVFAASVFPLSEFAALTDKKGKPLDDYRIDRRTAVNKMKGRIVVCRPLIEEWRCEFEVQLDLDACTPNLLQEVWQIAGQIVGVGSFRVENKGVFGRFTCNLKPAVR